MNVNKNILKYLVSAADSNDGSFWLDSNGTSRRFECIIINGKYRAYYHGASIEFNPVTGLISTDDSRISNEIATFLSKSTTNLIG